MPRLKHKLVDEFGAQRQISHLVLLLWVLSAFFVLFWGGGGCVFIHMFFSTFLNSSGLESRANGGEQESKFA